MSLVEILTKALAVIAALGITGFSAAAVAYWLFKTFAKGWLDSHFQKDLEALRAANVREVERLRADLSRYGDRATKFHGREYEILPEAWGLMNKAYGSAQAAISAFQQHANLDRMTDPHLEAWFKSSGLEDYQKDEIRRATDKNERYLDFLTWRQIGEAHQAVADFQNYVIVQGVFIEEDLSIKMMVAGKSMRGALISRSMVERTKDFHAPGQTDFWQKAIEELEPVAETVQEVKEAIRARLSDIKPPAP